MCRSAQVGAEVFSRIYPRGEEHGQSALHTQQRNIAYNNLAADTALRGQRGRR